MHTNCLKDIEELNLPGPNAAAAASGLATASAMAATSQSENKKTTNSAALATEKMEVPVSIVGQKRTYVDAQTKGSSSVSVGKLGAGGDGEMAPGGDKSSLHRGAGAVVDLQLSGLQDIIRGLE